MNQTTLLKIIILILSIALIVMLFKLLKKGHYAANDETEIACPTDPCNNDPVGLCSDGQRYRVHRFGNSRMITSDSLKFYREHAIGKTILLTDTSFFVSKKIIDDIWTNYPNATGIYCVLGAPTLGRVFLMIHSAKCIYLDPSPSFPIQGLPGPTDTYIYNDKIYCPPQCD